MSFARLPLRSLARLPSVPAAQPARRMLHQTPLLRAARGRDVGTGADPGYAAPSSTAKTDAEPEQAPQSKLDHTSDPFPLPFDPRLSGLSLSSKSQTDKLPGAVDWEGGPPPLNADEMDPETPVPLRVPGRGPADETREKRIARLVYQARKRGTLETDLLLSTFAREYLHQLPDAEVIEFDLVSAQPGHTQRKCHQAAPPLTLRTAARRAGLGHLLLAHGAQARAAALEGLVRDRGPPRPPAAHPHEERGQGGAEDAGAVVPS